MKNIDRISEAYNGQLGAYMQENSRTRINWMCSQAKGEKILDVGCSQGITSIILAREGKQVIGIDICQESIDFANNLLGAEDVGTQKNIEFICTDFTSFSLENEAEFDAIILGEILEHLADPKRFVKQAARILASSGALVVTVPFGINDYHDHKRTYYFLELYKTVGEYFSVTDISFLNGWLGIVGCKGVSQAIELDEKLFSQAENAFMLHEQKILTRNKRLLKEAEDVRERCKQLESDLKDNQSKCIKLESDLKDSQSKYTKLESDLKDSQSKCIKLESDLKDSQSKCIKLESDLKDSQNRYLQLDNDYVNCKKEKSDLERSYKQLITEHEGSNKILTAENDELLKKVEYATSELGKALSLLNNAENQNKHLNGKLNMLQKDNSKYRWQLSRITDTWYGKIGIKLYRLIGRITRRKS